LARKASTSRSYIAITGLPKGFVMKVGKMRSVFGKVIMMHNHVLPWVDRPLVAAGTFAIL
jgi:hypothetical protein